MCLVFNARKATKDVDEVFAVIAEYYPERMVPPKTRGRAAPISLIEMKTYKGLYEKIASFENLHSAFRKAAKSFACRKGKGTLAALAACRREVRRFPRGYVRKAAVSKLFRRGRTRFLLDARPSE